MSKSKNKKPSALRMVRRVLPAAVLLVAAAGFALHVDIGTISGFGWRDIALLCPLGALSTMLAAHAMLPRAVVSFALAVATIVLLGRAFCGWLCPVPLVSKLRDAFSNGSRSRRKKGGQRQTAGVSQGEAPAQIPDELSQEELALLKGSCSSCASRASLDSRHVVLGGALASAAVFGFPVFCLICPVGLSFATIFLLMRAFGAGDVTAALVVVPLVLVCEVVLFRSWCHKFCPLGALMSLVGKLNRTAQPSADPAACLEANEGVACGACAKACPEGIDPRHPERGLKGMNECTRCMTCVDACPARAITVPFLSKRGAGQSNGSKKADSE